MRIGLDLDGVVYPFTDVMRDWFKLTRNWPLERMPDPVDWHFAPSWGLTDEQFNKEMDIAVNAGFLFAKGEPMDDAAAVTREMAKDGHSIHVVTNRGSIGNAGQAQRATAVWLTYYGIHFDSLSFAPDKTIVRTDVFLEDNVKNCAELQAVGTAAYLRDQPYNRQGIIQTAGRVSSIGSFYGRARALVAAA